MPTLLFETGFGTGGAKLRFYTESLLSNDADKTLLGMYRLVITMNARFRMSEETPITTWWEADTWDASSYRAELGDVLALYQLPKPSGSGGELGTKRCVGQFDASSLTLASGMKLLSGGAEPTDSKGEKGNLYLCGEGYAYTHIGGISAAGGGWHKIPFLSTDEFDVLHANEGMLNVKGTIRSGNGFMLTKTAATIASGREAPTGLALTPGSLYLCTNDGIDGGIWVGNNDKQWKKVALPG